MHFIKFKNFVALHKLKAGSADEKVPTDYQTFPRIFSVSRLDLLVRNLKPLRVLPVNKEASSLSTMRSAKGTAEKV